MGVFGFVVLSAVIFCCCWTGNRIDSTLISCCRRRRARQEAKRCERRRLQDEERQMHRSEYGDRGRLLRQTSRSSPPAYTSVAGPAPPAPSYRSERSHVRHAPSIVPTFKGRNPSSTAKSTSQGSRGNFCIPENFDRQHRKRTDTWNSKTSPGPPPSTVSKPPTNRLKKKNRYGSEAHGEFVLGSVASHSSAGSSASASQCPLGT